MEDSPNCIKIKLRDKGYPFCDATYTFNDKGKQLKYFEQIYCDSCYKDYISKMLSNRIYRWVKLNDSTYITSYDNKILLNIHEYNYSYEVVRFSLTREEYKNLIGKK